MTWAGYEEDVQPALSNRSVEVDIDEVQPRRRPEVSEETGLDVFALEPFAEQWVVEQIDLTDGEVVRRTPVAVQCSDFTGRHVTHARPPSSHSPGERTQRNSSSRCLTLGLPNTTVRLPQPVPRTLRRRSASPSRLRLTPRTPFASSDDVQRITWLHAHRSGSRRCEHLHADLERRLARCMTCVPRPGLSRRFRTARTVQYAVAGHVERPAVSCRRARQASSSGVVLAGTLRTIRSAERASFSARSARRSARVR